MRKANLARLLARRPSGHLHFRIRTGEIGPDLFRKTCEFDLAGLCQSAGTASTAPADRQVDQGQEPRHYGANATSYFAGLANIDPTASRTPVQSAPTSWALARTPPAALQWQHAATFPSNRFVPSCRPGVRRMRRQRRSRLPLRVWSLCRLGRYRAHVRQSAIDEMHRGKHRERRRGSRRPWPKGLGRRQGCKESRRAERLTPALTRRRYPERQDYWRVYYGDARVTRVA